MDFRLAFDELSPQDPAFEQRLRKATSALQPSHHPLRKLRRAIRINLGLAIMLTLGLMLMITGVADAIVQLCLLVVLAFNAWAIITTLRLYRSLPDHIPAERGVLHVMRDHAQAIEHWMTAHKRVALFIYPVAATGGFLLGGAAGSGLSPAALLERPTMWLILLITLIVLVPLAHGLAGWMTRMAFGGHLAALRERIAELEGGVN